MNDVRGATAASSAPDLPLDEPTAVPLSALSRNELIYVLAMQINTIAEWCDVGEGFTREDYNRRLQRIRELADYLIGRKP